jgi:putative ABC transport system permease protein
MTRDLLHSLRWLRAHPPFAIAVTAILALGVGANTAVFSIVDAVLLRALPYESSPGLVRIVGASAKRSNTSLSAADYLSFADRHDLFRSTVPLIRDYGVTLTGAGEPDQFTALRTSGALFPLLGVHASLGRALSDSDDQPNAPNLAVLSDRLWQRRFHADPGVIGRAITVSGELYTVVGVMPPEFDFPAPDVEVWLSSHLTAASSGATQVAARLAPGISVAQAQAALEPVARQLERQNGEREAGLRLEVTPWSDVVPRESRLTLIFILAAVGLVLLIACADVAGLLLCRAVERQREIAIRASLGAGLWQVARQLLAEGLMFAALGSLEGIALARGVLAILTEQLAGLPINLPHLQRISLNGRVLLFNVALCLVLALLCSLAPVLFARKIDLQSALRAGHGARQKSSARLFSTLIAAETGFAFLLLAGSGLMLHSLIRLQQADRGFRPDHVLTLRVPIGGPGKYDTKPRQMAYYHDILERLQRIPGVSAAAFVNNLPLSGANTSLSTQRGLALVSARTVSAQYFTAMGIPLMEGRFFTDAEENNAPGVVINQSMARQQFPGRDAIGQHLPGEKGPGSGPEVIGVVKDSSMANYDDPVKAEEYVSYRQVLFGTVLSTFVVRTSGDPLKLADSLRKEVWAVDPDQPVVKVETMDDVVADSIWRPRFSAWVFAVLGGLALVLACAGIYSVIAYTAALRAREVGIRVALGATPSKVIALILRDALQPLAAGLAVSLIAALLLARLLTGLLYETGSGDPAAYLGAGAVLLIVGAAASAGPAVTAAAADPVRALRIE